MTTPFPKALFLCDGHIGYTGGKTDLMGLFHAIRPAAQYPYVAESFCVFAQLTGSAGRVPFFIDILDPVADELIWTSQTRELVFPRRDNIIQLALTVQKCRFAKSGLYIVQLFCDNQFVCDAPLKLLEPIH